MSEAIIESLLMEHGYPPAHIRESLESCGPDMQRCVEFCLERANGPVDQGSACVVPESEENWCAAAIHSLGFDESLVTLELERNGFSFSKTLALFINGGDESRGLSRFRRHTRKKVVGGLNLARVASLEVRQEYLARANDEFSHLDLRVVDLGQYSRGMG